MPNERWVFTETEIRQLAMTPQSQRDTLPKFNSLDEFLCALPEISDEDDKSDEDDNKWEQTPLIAYRNSSLSNRWADGTVGIPDELRELADDVQTYSTLDGGDYATVWLDVACDSQGNLVELLEPLWIIRVKNDWHLFDLNAGHQVAGPFTTERQARLVRRSMDKGASDAKTIP